MGTTFRAICPATSALHVFEVVSEKGRTVGWCTKCRKTWPLSELSDRQGDDDAVTPEAPRRPSGKHRPKTGRG